MSIQSEIERIEAARDDIAAAIREQDVTVPTGAKLDALAGYVRQIVGKVLSVCGKGPDEEGNIALTAADVGAAVEGDTAWMMKAVYDTQGRGTDVYEYADGTAQTHANAIVSWLYKATFLVNGWSGSAAPYTQTVTVEAVTGGPAITAASTMTSAVMIDDTIQGDARAALLAAASLVDGGTKTFGEGTMTCVLQESKPNADAEVYFCVMQGGVS